MKKLLIISLISSSLLLVWCFNNETKLETISQVKENKEFENINTWSAKVNSWSIEQISTTKSFFKNDCVWIKIGDIKNRYPRKLYVYFWKEWETVDNLVKYSMKSLDEWDFYLYDKTSKKWDIDIYLSQSIKYDSSVSPIYIILKKWNIFVYYSFEFSSVQELYDTINDYKNIPDSIINNIESYWDFECKTIKTSEKFHVEKSDYSDLDEYIKGELKVFSNPISSSDFEKDFNIDDYFEKWTYSVIKKLEKWDYTVLTIDNTNSWLTINNDNKEDPSCYNYCVNFILNKNKLIYTNLLYKWENDYRKTKPIWALWDIKNDWAVFYFPFEWWMSESYFTYINFKTLKLIFEVYNGWWCWYEELKDCKPISTKRFYNKWYWEFSRKDQLKIKSTNIEDAYFEYYK